MKVGFFYYFDENWAGGSYYFLSLIQMSKYISNEKNLQIFILHDKTQNLQDLRTGGMGNENRIRFIKFQPSNQLFGKIYSKILFKYILKDVKFYLFSLKTVYLNIQKKNRFFWLGDLQNRVTPEYFDTINLSKRLKYQDSILLGSENVVVTSCTMFKEVKQFYKDTLVNSEGRIYIAPFASFLDTYNVRNTCSESTLSLKNPYFYLPNQFWAHKNHIVVIEAFEILKSEGKLNFDLVLTGKEYDFRNPEYTARLKSRIAEYNLTNNFIFLGFVDRTVQIEVFQKAIAIIQPSFYEGWGTVVEDSKALNKKVIASNIPIHIEQLKNQAAFFNPTDSKFLAKILYDEYLNYANNDFKVVSIDYNYNSERVGYAHNFYKIFES